MFLALLPLLLSLAIGFALGRLLPSHINNVFIKSITPLVWGMLLLIGFELGEVIFTAGTIAVVLIKALVFSLLTTLIPFALIAFVTRDRHQQAAAITSKQSRLQTVIPAIKEALIALSMVAFGMILFTLQYVVDFYMSLPSSSLLLLLLIFLVGVDLSTLTLSKSWLSWRLLGVPALVWLGSWLAALPAAWLCGETLKTALGLSSGFGWFTLSSVLFSEKMGHEYGMMALMIDLFRELLAITLIYLVGRNHPKAVVGGAGATAADTTLPMIKSSCGGEWVPLAMLSGVILSLLAPILMTIFIN